jgi:hypothetical protein
VRANLTLMFSSLLQATCEILKHFADTVLIYACAVRT